MKRVIIRPEADRDFDLAASHYASVHSVVAEDFLREVNTTYARISAMPGIGSPRLSQEVSVGGLRSHSLEAFPYTIVYFEREDRIDVVRILHMHRDIFKLLLGVE